MQFTSSRVAALALTAVLVVAAALPACGQVTGLSDDFQYDLEGGASTDAAATDAAAEGSTGDGAADAATDAANKCTSAQSTKAAKTLAQLGGTSTCKVCLAGSCCNDVDACALSSDCLKVLSCKLDCSQQTIPAEHAQCLKSCSSGANSATTLYTSTVGTCASAECGTPCALQ